MCYVKMKSLFIAIHSPLPSSFLPKFGEPQSYGNAKLHFYCRYTETLMPGKIHETTADLLIYQPSYISFLSTEEPVKFLRHFLKTLREDHSCPILLVDGPPVFHHGRNTSVTRLNQELQRFKREAGSGVYHLRVKGNRPEKMKDARDIWTYGYTATKKQLQRNRDLLFMTRRALGPQIHPKPEYLTEEPTTQPRTDDAPQPLSPTVDVDLFEEMDFDLGQYPPLSPGLLDLITPAPAEDTDPIIEV